MDIDDKHTTIKSPPGTTATPNHLNLRLPAAVSSRLQRVRFWWHATDEIRTLTADPKRERLYAEAAVHLTPSPGNIAHLFRRP